MGARPLYYDLPDCIYRRLADGSFLVNGEDDLWQPLHPQEAETAAALTGWLKANLAPGDQLVSPMTLGSHVDHHLVRAAAEAVFTSAGAPDCQLAYYADYPYAVREPDALRRMLRPSWRELCVPVSPAGLLGWQAAIAQHVSQISTFWNGLEDMQAALESYWRAGGGACLWASDAG